MIKINQDCIVDVLNSEYKKIKEKNSQYSLRSFSKKIGVSPGALSEILNSKREISEKKANNLANILNLNSKDRSFFLSCFTLNKRFKTRREYDEIKDDLIKNGFNWIHFTILSLIELDDFVPDARWCANKIGSEITLVREAFQFLIKEGIIFTNERGQFCRSEKPLSTSDDQNRNSNIQRNHIQTIDMAKRSLINDDIEKRDITAITYSFDSKQIKEVKALIRKFQDDLSLVIDSSKNKDSVYKLAMQFFPLTTTNEIEQDNIHKNFKAEYNKNRYPYA